MTKKDIHVVLHKDGWASGSGRRSERGWVGDA